MRARAGRSGFSGVEYPVAKSGMQLMAELPSTDDRPTTVTAADWSEARVNVCVRPTC